MSVERITTIEALERLAPEWRELEADSRLVLPFNTSDWAICWWRHLRRDGIRGLLQRDRLFTLAIRDPERRLLGVAPLMITGRPGVGPVRARRLQYIGTDPNLTEVRTLLARAGHEQAVYQQVCEHAQRARDRWDWMDLTGVDATGDGPAVLQAHGVDWVGQRSAWLLPLAPTWEEFRSRLSRNIKESLRKCANAPKRDGLEFQLLVATRPEEIAASLEELFELHTERASQTDTIRHRDVFQGVAARRFLLDVCQRFARRGIVHLFNLKLGEQTIASRVGFLLGGTMYLYYSGFREKYAKYSVMTTCVAETIRWSIGAGVRMLNLSTGTDVSKTRWGPQEQVFRDARLVSPGLRGRAIHAVFRWTERLVATERLRELLARLGLRPS